MKWEIFGIVLILVAALIFSIINDDIAESIPPEDDQPFSIQEHNEPVHYYFKNRAFRDEYYEIITSG